MAGKRWTALTAALLGSLVIFLGCSSFKEPNEKNFLPALNAYYSHHNECLFTNNLTFPYETAIKDQSGAGSKGMDALTASDLMKRQEAKLIGVNRYTLTPAGERVGGRFCYGYREVTAVPSFTPPVTRQWHANHDRDAIDTNCATCLSGQILTPPCALHSLLWPSPPHPMLKTPRSCS